DTSFVKTDSRGWIWRGTSRGVYASDGRAQSPEDWLFLDTGRESRQFGFFEDRDGSVWIATADGVSHLKPSPAWFRDAPGVPLPDRIYADAAELVSFPEALDPAPRTLKLRFSKWKSNSYWRQPFRYRIAPLFEDWHVAPGGIIEWP